MILNNLPVLIAEDEALRQAKTEEKLRMKSGKVKNEERVHDDYVSKSNTLIQNQYSERRDTPKLMDPYKVATLVYTQDPPDLKRLSAEVAYQSLDSSQSNNRETCLDQTRVRTKVV